MRTRSKLFFLTILISTFSLASANATEQDHPSFINWSMIERWTYNYDYELYEKSNVVDWLQFWLGVKPRDSIYGPETNRLHRQRAMELGITVRLHLDVVPDRDFGPEVEQWRETVLEAIVANGGPSEDLTKFLKVMRCESMGDPNAYNSSSGASGLMQHLQVYWDNRARLAGFEGASPFDPVANIYTSAWLLYRATGGGWQHWVCQ